MMGDHVPQDVLPFVRSHPRSGKAVQNTTMGHCAEKYAKFANKTYGEVLRMYQTLASQRKQPMSSELLIEKPKSASHHYKLKPSISTESSSEHDAISNIAVCSKNNNTTVLVPVPANWKRNRARKPWVTDKLVVLIQHEHDLYNKWVKVQKRICSKGVTDIKGGICTCPICVEKRNRFNTYNKYKISIRKLKWEAKLSYYGGVVDDLKKKKKDNAEISGPADIKQSGPLSNDTVKSNITDGMAVVTSSDGGNSSSRQPVAMDKSLSALLHEKEKYYYTTHKWMGYLSAVKEFNPAFPRDFGMQLRSNCGNYYMVGTNTPTDPEEKGVLMTNLRYDMNWSESLLHKVKKYGAVQKLHCRFMQQKHIALVEYKDHKSALRFAMSPGKYKKQPIIRKFWRKILPVPDSCDKAVTSVQTPTVTVPTVTVPPGSAPAGTLPSVTVQPAPKKLMISNNLDTLRNSKTRSSVPPSSSKEEKSHDTHSPLNMLVPAIVPSLEDAGPVKPAQNAHSFVPKRKPLLKLNQKSACPEPTTKDDEVVDSEDDNQECTIISVKAAPEPELILIDDDDDDEPSSSSAADTDPVSSESHKEPGKEMPVLVGSEANTLPVTGCDMPSTPEKGIQMVTPSGLTLVPHSFRILPPPKNNMLYVVTGSLVPSIAFPTTLILRGIPSQLNFSSRLRPALEEFGRCNILLRYLGLQTTSCVEYQNHKDAAACFQGLYMQLDLEYLKVYWMDTLPLPDPDDSGAEDTDEIELEIAPGKNRGKMLEEYKERRKRLYAFKTWKTYKAYTKGQINKHFRWKPKLSATANASLIKKNQTLLSNNIKSQKNILARLESCEDLKTKERLMNFLKKLEDTHHVTAANLKALRSSSDGTEGLSSTNSTPPSGSKQDCKNVSSTNSQPKSIKVLNFSDQDVLQKHFSKFGKCSVLSYVADKTNVVLCQFERRKEALIAFVRGREMIWVEWGNEKMLELDLEWDFSDPIVSMETFESIPPSTEEPSKVSQITGLSTQSTKESSDQNDEQNDDHPRSIKILNFSDQDVLQRHFANFGKCSVLSYVVDKNNLVLCKFENRKEAIIAFSRGRTMNWVEWGNKKEKVLELEWDFSKPIVTSSVSENSQPMAAELNRKPSSEHEAEPSSSSYKQIDEDHDAKILQIFD